MHLDGSSTREHDNIASAEVPIFEEEDKVAKSGDLGPVLTLSIMSIYSLNIVNRFGFGGSRL